jgi:hypothetical protein
MDYSTLNLPSPSSPPPPAGRAGRGLGAFSSASPGTFVREFAFGREATFVDAFQAFRDHCLQLPDLVLLIGVFRIHQCAVTCASTGLTTDDGCLLA